MKYLIIMALGLSLSFTVSCQKEDHSGHKYKASEKPSRVETYYTCSMHPQIK